MPDPSTLIAKVPGPRYSRLRCLICWDKSYRAPWLWPRFRHWSSVRARPRCMPSISIAWTPKTPLRRACLRRIQPLARRRMPRCGRSTIRSCSPPLWRRLPPSLLSPSGPTRWPLCQATARLSQHLPASVGSIAGHTTRRLAASIVRPIKPTLHRSRRHVLFRDRTPIGTCGHSHFSTALSPVAGRRFGGLRAGRH